MSVILTLSEFRIQNATQRILQDLDALDLGDQNCRKLLRAIGIKRAYNLRPNVVSRGDLIQHVIQNFPVVDTYLSDNGFVALLAWVFYKTDGKMIAQRMSTMSYFIACNGLCVTNVGNLYSAYLLMRDYSSVEEPELLKTFLSTVSDTVVLCRMPVKCEESKTVITDRELPPALQNYLSSMCGATAIVRAVTRLQKLAPETILKEDPYKALIVAWNNMNKEV